MKLWFDDVRQAPPGWTWAKNVEEAKRLLLTGEVERASLDHDIGYIIASDGRRIDIDPEQPFKVIVRGQIELAPREPQGDGTDLVRWMIAEDI